MIYVYRYILRLNFAWLHAFRSQMSSEKRDFFNFTPVRPNSPRPPHPLPSASSRRCGIVVHTGPSPSAFLYSFDRKKNHSWRLMHVKTKIGLLRERAYYNNAVSYTVHYPFVLTVHYAVRLQIESRRHLTEAGSENIRERGKTLLPDVGTFVRWAYFRAD